MIYAHNHQDRHTEFCVDIQMDEDTVFCAPIKMDVHTCTVFCAHRQIDGKDGHAVL